MDNSQDKNIVYCYDSKGHLKNIKSFDTLEECFDFISKQHKKENQFLQLDLF